MARERLSARQKMIGMMYLVLTAMLALQVSSSVLDKFILLSKSIEKSNELRQKTNIEKLAQIKALVKETGSRKNDVEVLHKALNIRKETKKVTDYIDHVKAKLIALTGGINPKTKLPKGLKNDSIVAQVMINNKGADELKRILNSYTQYLSRSVKKEYTPIAVDAHEHDFFKNDPNQMSKNFATLNFDHTPVGTALATLSQFSAQVIHAEADALERLANIVGAGDVKFDILCPLVNAQSNIVAAGTTYQADLLLTASSSGVTPEMTIDGKKIPVENGIGKISFLASPGDYNKDGLAKKTFKAAIKLKTPGGVDSTLVKDIVYYVAKPVMQIQAAAVQALYLNCGNELNIQFPTLGAAYNPVFTATGAQLITSQDRGLVTIIPKEAEVKLHVHNNGSSLDTKIFKVRTIPKPEIRVTSGGKVLNEKQGMPSPGPRKLEVRVVPDESFQLFLPKDARYRVAQWEVTLARGSRPISVKKVTSQEVKLNDFASLAKPGDRLVIEVKKVERLTFKGEIETHNVSAIFNIPLN